MRFDLGAVYDATLASVKQSFPQYIRELEGVADGAEVEFHKVIRTVNFLNKSNKAFSYLSFSYFCFTWMI